MSVLSEREPASAGSREVLAAHAVTLPSGNWRIDLAPADGFLAEPPAPEPRRGEVQWYVPFTAVHPRTVAGAPSDAIWVDVSASPDAYYWALREIWSRGESFALLEHDVVCRPDVIEVFETSPELRLAFGYSDICHVECMEAWANTLGCTRFRDELIAAVPDAVESIPTELRIWTNVCDGLGKNLQAAGFTHSWAFPWVEHHHFGRHD